MCSCKFYVGTDRSSAVILPDSVSEDPDDAEKWLAPVFQCPLHPSYNQESRYQVASFVGQMTSPILKISADADGAASHHTWLSVRADLSLCFCRRLRLFLQDLRLRGLRQAITSRSQSTLASSPDLLSSPQYP